MRPVAWPPGAGVVVLPEASIEAIEYRTGGDASNEPHKLPSRVRYRDVVLRRGLIGSLDLYSWWSQVRDGDVVGARRTVIVQLLKADDASRACDLSRRFHTIDGGRKVERALSRGTAMP